MLSPLRPILHRFILYIFLCLLYCSSSVNRVQLFPRCLITPSPPPDQMAKAHRHLPLQLRCKPTSPSVLPTESPLPAASSLHSTHYFINKSAPYSMNHVMTLRKPSPVLAQHSYNDSTVMTRSSS